jgi:hypothetical protein
MAVDWGYLELHTPESIVKEFEKPCVSDNMNGTEYDVDVLQE